MIPPSGVVKQKKRGSAIAVVFSLKLMSYQPSSLHDIEGHLLFVFRDYCGRKEGPAELLPMISRRKEGRSGN